MREIRTSVLFSDYFRSTKVLCLGNCRGKVPGLEVSEESFLELPKASSWRTLIPKKPIGDSALQILF